MPVKQRTMITNSLRSLLAEFGVGVLEGSRYVSELIVRVADPEDTSIPSDARIALRSMIEVLNTLNEQIAALEARIRALVRENEGMRRLQTEVVPRPWTGG
jgi:transposase